MSAEKTLTTEQVSCPRGIISFIVLRFAHRLIAHTINPPNQKRPWKYTSQIEPLPVVRWNASALEIEWQGVIQDLIDHHLYTTVHNNQSFSNSLWVSSFNVGKLKLVHIITRNCDSPILPIGGRTIRSCNPISVLPPHPLSFAS